jgi:hypothetical protein
MSDRIFLAIIASADDSIAIGQIINERIEIPGDESEAEKIVQMVFKALANEEADGTEIEAELVTGPKVN